MTRTWMPLTLLTFIALVSLAVSEPPVATDRAPIDIGNTAWMLTATGLVLLMTPGLSYFYAGMVSTKN